MKKLLIFVLSAALCFAAAAQQKVEKNSKHGVKLTKEEMVEKKCKTVSDKLMLDDAAAAKFTPVYRNYLNELSENVDFKKFSDDNEMNDADIDKDMKNGFERKRKLVDIREKYYGEFRKFLTAKQAKSAIKMGDATRIDGKRLVNADTLQRRIPKRQLDFTHDKQRLNKENPPLKTE
ncbi:MAG: hypothetical protein LBE11_01145 [Prevotellaceae bacterium]|jgi:uncharacterized membrane protein|nr:hypothetical protein [Prevotellaceae bacterium]